ncbi:MAG TPA: nickel-dependent hydrogenase large subunit [Vicinamibacterales bacterium]|nr:nickel-dependent hydrogenase large subunit [Vicinamibacterales bacterium]
MCFKNLPVEFDEQGNASLRGGIPDPYTASMAPANVPMQLTHEQVEELVRRNGHVKSVDFDPVTRVAGALAFHAVADLKERRIYEARSVATLFRGYEVIMVGRDPRDAIYITSRACGVCGGVHSTCSSLAIEMAIDCVPPPLGVIVRNLALALEFLYDHPLHLHLLAGPDYSAAIVEPTNPALYARAKKTEAPHADVHGYKTMAALMEDLNPLTGKLYVEALHMTRVAREAYVLICGKYPHPQTIVPGGMSSTITLTVMNEMYVRLSQFFDYSKKMAGIWDDITDFFYEANPAYKQVGQRRANMIDTGIFDHPDAYDATYKNASAWGDRRWATPGAIVDGKLVTTDLHKLNMGLEEFVEHSYYEEWTGEGQRQRFPNDPSGNPLSPYHPWNKITKPRPGAQSWKEKYTWDTAPRWDRLGMEAGCYARLWNTAVAQKMPKNPFIESTGHSLKVRVPKGALPEMELEWHVPEVWNAFERNRARAHCVAFTAMVAMNNWLAAMDRLKNGDTKTSTPFEIPKTGERLGVGFWGAGRGYLTHHLVLDRGAVSNYQIVTPSTWNASPTDRWGQPGPYEEAVMNTPLLEESDNPEDFRGIDVLRAIRSFDPCMPCTTHIHSDAGVVTREVNTCACGVED